MATEKLSLADGLALSGLDLNSLWRSYFALGGTGSSGSIGEHVRVCGCPDANEHNLIAQAINESFLEHGGDHPVAYRGIADNETGGEQGR